MCPKQQLCAGIATAHDGGGGGGGGLGLGGGGDGGGGGGGGEGEGGLRTVGAWVQCCSLSSGP
jgi:hypothetical protein